MWVLLLLSAWAVDIPTKTGSEIGVGCVAHVQASAPILVLDAQRYLLHDDGKEPDMSSSDGIFSVFVSTKSQKKVAASLLGDGNTILWSGDVPFPPKGQQTWLIIDELNEGQNPLVKVKFKPIASTQGAQKSSFSWWIYWFLLGVGAILGWIFRRPNIPKIYRWSITNKDIEHRICIVDEEQQLLETVERYSRGALVLLCTHKERQHLFLDIAQKNSIFLMNNEIPCERHSLLSQLSILETLGDAILILDGMHGLVEPLPSESPCGVLNEIISVSGHNICIVFLRGEVPDGIDDSNAVYQSTADQ